jgi:AraC-like DNA-binding protein
MDRRLDTVAMGAATTSPDMLARRVLAFRPAAGSTPAFRVWPVSVGGVRLVTVESGAYDIVTEEDGGNTLVLPLQGRVEVRLRRRSFAASDGDLALFRPGRRASSIRPPPGGPFRAIGLVVPRPPPGMRGGAEAPGVVFGRAALPPAASALRNYMHFVVRELTQADSPLHRPAAARAASALILDLAAELDLFDRPADPGEIPVGEARVKEAEEIMWHRFQDPLTVEEIARLVGIGPRALQLAFRARRGMAPRAALAAFRLERARSLMLAAGPGTNVTNIALQCGFLHFGRFAAAYRARFGESPSETLRRARG